LTLIKTPVYIKILISIKFKNSNVNFNHIMKIKYNSITQKDWEELRLFNLRNKGVDNAELQIIEKLLEKLKKDRSLLENKFAEFINANLENKTIVNDFFMEFNMKVGNFSDDTKFIEENVKLSIIGQQFYFLKAFDLCLDFNKVYREYQSKTFQIRTKLNQND